MRKGTVILMTALLVMVGGLAATPSASACQINLGTCYPDCPTWVILNVGHCGTPPQPPENGP